MNKPRPKMSAASAIAIEHQVDDIIAVAKAICVQQAYFSKMRGIMELTQFDEAYLGRRRAASMLALSRKKTDRRFARKSATAGVELGQRFVKVRRSQADGDEIYVDAADPHARVTKSAPRGFWNGLRSFFIQTLSRR